jgi:hypothetical protein
MSDELDLLTQAFDRHRLRTFGDSSLTLLKNTPAAGETTNGTPFAAGWKGRRVADITAGVRTYESGQWQFQIIAAVDWVTSQAFMFASVALTVGTERWKITKVQKPIGIIPVWKIRCEIESNG